MKKNYVYIVKCNDGTYYTGWTTDLEERIRKHNRGVASAYTRARLPVKLIYYEESQSKSDALKREYAIKKMAKKDKERLIYG
mgnify:CR=1 FL=1